MEKVKTGQFSTRTVLRPGLSEDERNYVRRRMWADLGLRVMESVRDGRMYSVLYYDTEYCDEEGEFGPCLVLHFWINLVLQHDVEAEVGEVVQELRVEVPESVNEYRMPEGPVFERDGLGWRRIE